MHSNDASSSQLKRSSLAFGICGVTAGLLIGVLISDLGNAADALRDAVVLIGVLSSWFIGIYVVAPRASAMAKQKIAKMLADPEPEDEEITQLLSTHIIGGASQLARAALAEDDRGKTLRRMFEPFYDLAIKRLDERFDFMLKNVASQRSRGAGAFNPENIPPEELERMKQEFVQDVLMEPVGGIIEALGVTGKNKEAGTAYVMSRLLKFGEGANAQRTSPQGGSGQGW